MYLSAARQLKPKLAGKHFRWNHAYKATLGTQLATIRKDTARKLSYTALVFPSITEVKCSSKPRAQPECRRSSEKPFLQSTINPAYRRDWRRNIA